MMRTKLKLVWTKCARYDRRKKKLEEVREIRKLGDAIYGCYGSGYNGSSR